MYLGPGTYIQLCAEAQAPMEGDEPYVCQTGRLSIGVLRTTSLPVDVKKNKDFSERYCIPTF